MSSLQYIDVVTIFPEMFQALHAGVIGTYIEQSTLSIAYWNPRDYSDNAQGYIDDRPYGGGPGMVMQAAPLFRAVEAIATQRAKPGRVVLLSPAGKPLTPAIAQSLVAEESVTLICGRYEGVDQRFTDQVVDEVISIGDYVLSGGELPAMVLIDSMLRFMPGCLGNAASAVQDSFTDACLDHDHYTRPASIHGEAVPSVLLGGNHADITRWRRKNALGNTWLQRPDLLAQNLDCNDKKLLLEYVAEYLTKHEEKP
jgi:tRNA (guanine37-N1)-methyltransferase